MKKLSTMAVVTLFVTIGILAVAYWSWGQMAAGPIIISHADITCPSASTTMALPASTPAVGSGAQVSNRMCAEVDWVSGSPMRIGDSAITASRGVPIPAVTGASKTFCGDGPIYCWGAGGTSVGAFNETTRQ